MTSSVRRVAACALGLALVAGPAVAGGTVTSADAASLHRAKATATARVTVTAHRSAAATFKATVVATVPDGSIAPIRVTMSATATRTMASAASSARKKTVTARAATKAKAKARAKALARKAARKLARSAAASRAASAAAAKARTAANAAARAQAIRLANAKAVAEAKQAAPGSIPSTGVVSANPVAAPCGGMTPAKAGGGVYSTCTFDDDFTGGTLDPSKWTAMDSRQSGVAVGDECFRPENVSQSGGTLQLTGTKSAESLTCAKKARSYMSGQVTTKGLFSQTYGRFEMRAKFPKDAGYVSGFWMLPENPLADGYTKYKYGEIDVVENWALHPELKWAHLHYAATPGNLMGGKACSIASDDNFHTYAVDWSASSMTFSYDGNTCWTTTWRPLYPYAPIGSSAPAPFDQPFYMIINLSLGGSGSTLAQPLSKTPMGKSLQVDWVRAWK